jgi:transmembrane sensor
MDTSSLEPIMRKLGTNAPTNDPPRQDAAFFEALAEASAWIVLLNDSEPPAGVEQGLQRWLEESPRHRHAFEHAMETWRTTRATLWRAASGADESKVRAGKQGFRQKALLGLAASLLIAIVGLYFDRSELATRIGERRTFVLEDGTQVTLNTSSRLEIDYDRRQRRVHLRSGEAIFYVRKRPDWPFVVTIGEREVTALGTSFLVRRDMTRTAVTLLQGKVEVTSHAASRPGAGDARSPSWSAVTLAPGERVVFAQGESSVLDRPDLENLTGWRHGLVNISDQTLAKAAEEMNRYSTLQIVVTGAATDLRVSGVFRTTDAESFARAVALTHGLQLRREGSRIVLFGEISPSSESRFDASRSRVDNASLTR